jgi:hypothetical protein
MERLLPAAASATPRFAPHHPPRPQGETLRALWLSLTTFPKFSGSRKIRSPFYSTQQNHNRIIHEYGGACVAFLQSWRRSERKLKKRYGSFGEK